MIHILTLNWNGLELLKSLKPGLDANLKKIGIPYKWYIKENGSNDGSKKWIEKKKDIRILASSHNRDNFSQGVNALFKLANPPETDLLLLLNNDIFFKDDVSLLNMISLMRKTNSHVVGCKLNNTDGTISHAGIVFSEFKGNMPWNYRSSYNEEKKDRYDRYFQAVTAACSFISVKAFKEAGMLPEYMNWAFDDVILNLNISKTLGYKIAYCGSTNIEHKTSSSLKKNPVNKMFLHQNVKHFKEKWFGKYKLDHKRYLANPNYKVIK